MAKMILIVAIVLFPLHVWGQNGLTIEGTVTDTDGNPLPGANILIEGTDIGTTVGTDGTYELHVPDQFLDGETASLMVRFVSYQTTSETINLQEGVLEIDFELQSDHLQLDEVIVTGQGGTTERRQLTSSVSTISSDQIGETVSSSIDELLQGQIAGASIRAQSAQPGQAGLMNFRGITSFTGSQTPVIYIDGVRVDTQTGMGFDIGGEQSSALSDILTSDIERVEVTKGGAASTLYGSEAASGVIQIFTERGRPGTPQLQFNTQVGIDQPEDKYILDAEFAYPDLVEAGEENPNFVRDEFLRTGLFQNHQLGISGGTDEATYNVSGRVQNSDGVQPRNNHALYNLRGGLQTLIAERFTADFSGSYTRSNFNRIFSGTAIADPLTALEVGDALAFSGQDNLDDALDVFTRPRIEESVDRFTLSSTFNYNPSANFSNQVILGVDHRGNEQRIFEPLEFPITTDIGRVDRFNRDYTTYSLEYRGNLHHTITDWLTSDLSFGIQGFRELESQIWSTGRNFTLPGVEDFGAAADITSNESREQIFSGGLYLQDRLGFYDRTFVELGVRLDGNSAFGVDVGLQAYPKFGLAYNISDLSGWEDLFGTVWSNMRLHAAYGQTGQFPDAFARERTLTAIPFRGESAPRFDNPGDDELGPERTETFEAGFDAAFLQDRISLDLTGYYARTYDAILNVAEQPVTGLTNQYRNVGEMENYGIEIEWNAQLMDYPNFRWSIGGNFHTFTNEVVDIGTLEPFTMGPGGHQRIEEGRPIGEYYVTHTFDSSGDGHHDSSERRYTGTTPYPTLDGSVNTRFNLFGSITVSALADWATGHEVMDWGAQWAQFNGLNRVEFPIQYDADGNELGEFDYPDTIVSIMEPGDYLKIRNISVNYSMPASLINDLGISSANLTFAIRNAVIFSKTDLVDPELSGVAGAGDLQLGGVTSITLPAPRQFRLGLELTF